MKKLEKAVIVISGICEVFMWVGAILSIVMIVLSSIGRIDLLKYVASVDSTTKELTMGGFSIGVTDAAGNHVSATYVIFSVTMLLTFLLVGMICRNVNLIFKTTAGKTWFSQGNTPFQPDNIRMVREIGIFFIFIPVIQLIMSIIARIVIPFDYIEASVGMQNVFVGLVVIALSQYFAYGMELQNDIDGLV